MFLEFLTLLIGYYLFAGVATYVFAVAKSHEITGFWNLKIDKKYIAGICPYPYWMLFWLERIVNGFKQK